MYVGGSEGLRKLIQQREYHGSKALFARGRSKWVAGQLDRELDRGGELQRVVR